MSQVMVDSNVILDIFLDDPVWANWSEMTLNQYVKSHQLIINPLIYTELSIGFQRIEEVEEELNHRLYQTFSSALTRRYGASL